MTLEQRKKDFVLDVYSYDEPKDLLDDFISYWTEHNKGGRKMRFEMSKNQPFNIGRRIGTWKRNQKRFNPENKEKANFLKERYGLR